MRNWLGSGVLVAAMALVGCGGGGESKPITTDDFCTQKAAKECEKPSENCPITKTECQDARKTACNTAVAALRAAFPSRTFKASNIASCLNQTAAAYASVPIKPPQFTAMDEACQLVFQGSAAKSEKCTSKYDCAQSNLICDKGKCATSVTRNMGDGCSDPGEVCATGSYCFKDGDTYSCVAKHKAGEACDADTNPCLEALRCAAGMCTDRAAAGEMCMDNGDCATTVPFCDKSFTPAKCDTGLTLSGGTPACTQFAAGS